MAPAALDTLGLSFGPWSLGEQAPGAWPAHYARGLEAKEKVPAELLLVIDPLVSISTAIAARTWVWSLVFAGAILLVCLAVPRGFCGYVCPLGTLIDLFDWVLGRRVSRSRGSVTGWWRRSEILCAHRRAGVQRVRCVDLRICRGDPCDHAWPGVPVGSAADGRVSRLVSGAAVGCGARGVSLRCSCSCW